MFAYMSKGNSNLKIKDSPIDTIPEEFFTEILGTEKKEWPGIVRKYNLTHVQLEAAAGWIKREEESKKSMAQWSANASAYYAKKYPIKC